MFCIVLILIFGVSLNFTIYLSYWRTVRSLLLLLWFFILALISQHFSYSYVTYSFNFSIFRHLYFALSQCHLRTWHDKGIPFQFSRKSFSYVLILIGTITGCFEMDNLFLFHIRVCAMNLTKSNCCRQGQEEMGKNN